MPRITKRDPAEIIAALQDRVSKLEADNEVVADLVKDLLLKLREKDKQIEELKAEAAISQKAQIQRLQSVLKEVMTALKSSPSGPTGRSGGKMDAADIDYLARAVARRIERNRQEEKGGSRGLPGWVIFTGAILAAVGVLAVAFYFIMR